MPNTSRLTARDETHCRHVRYIGNMLTRDHLCGDCELGTTDEDFLAAQRYERIRRLIRNRTAPALAKRAADATIRARLITSLKLYIR